MHIYQLTANELGLILIGYPVGLGWLPVIATGLPAAAPDPFYRFYYP